MQRFWRKTRHWAIGVGVSLGVAALGGFNPSPSWAQMPATTTPLDLSAVEIVPPSPVELLVVGAQPTSPLRLRPIKGQQQTSKLSFATTSKVKINDRVMPNLDLPTIRATTEHLVQNVAINGDIQHQFVYRQVALDAPPAGAAVAMQPLFDQIKAFEGLSGDAVMTDAAVQKSLQLRFPSTMTSTQQALLEQFSQSMNQLASPFPSGPIGVGSRWRQVSPIRMNGDTFTQTATYSLTALDGNLATIAVDLTITTDAKVLATNQPMIGDLAIKSMVSTGKGKLVWDLTQLVPRSSDLTINMQMVTEPTKFKLGDQPLLINTDTQIQLNLTAAP
jgi:hypothetical protein